MKKIKCQPTLSERIDQVRVRIIKAPVVNSDDLHHIIYARTRAIVL